ncbi:hypothetical protein LJC72_05830 [Bacteroides sp. OttesenSCG-928-D19]|nr:hypothetical protein [Bacteroides sp. OttesenSCG-928-D19]
MAYHYRNNNGNKKDNPLGCIVLFIIGSGIYAMTKTQTGLGILVVISFIGLVIIGIISYFTKNK